MKTTTVSKIQSQQLEKCFYKMQTRCQIEIDKIEAILFSPKTLVLKNIDSKNAFLESIANINKYIVSAVGFYAETLIETNPKESVTSLIKELFTDDLSTEIHALENIILSTINKPTLLHPTILINYHESSQKIKDMRPSTLIEIIDKIEV